jgi:hypothetical protein
VHESEHRGDDVMLMQIFSGREIMKTKLSVKMS